MAECMRCFHELVEIKNTEDEYDVEVKEYHCPHCGAIEIYYPCEEEDKKILAFFFCRLRQEFPLDNPEPNFPETEKYLQQGIQKLFTAEGLKTIRGKLPEEYLFYTTEFVRSWADAASALGSQENYWRLKLLNPDWVSLIDECTYLFKECYADLMMVLTLGLSSETYLNMFQEDLIRAEMDLKHAFLTREAQRIALVLRACTEAKINDSDATGSWKTDRIRSNLENTSIPQKVKHTILACYDVLLDNAKAFPVDMDDNTRMRLFPRASIQYVKDYLDEVYGKFQTCFVKGKHSEELRTITKEFKDFFIEGKFISNEYFQIIRANHEVIRTNRGNTHG